MVRYSIRLIDGEGYGVYVAKFNKCVAVLRSRAQAQQWIVDRYRQTRTSKRKLEIIQQLADMSKDGWKNARPCDYEPLEQELREIEGR